MSVKSHRIHPAIRERARELRQPQTPAEQLLWAQLRDRRLDGLKFRRQHPIGQFIADFYCAERRLVVEIDGDTHADQADYDQARTEWLNDHGYTVLRFTNREVQGQMRAVLEAIWEACEGQVSPSPRPSPCQGEGVSPSSPALPPGRGKGAGASPLSLEGRGVGG